MLSNTLKIEEAKLSIFDKGRRYCKIVHILVDSISTLGFLSPKVSLP
jgi:hypothetical protein